MKLRTEYLKLKLKHPFKTARHIRYDATSIKVILEHKGFTALGEAQPSEYYFGENHEGVIKTIEAANQLLGDDPFQIEDIMSRLHTHFPKSPAALAGIDIALHDLVGKLLNIPLYQYFGLNPDKRILTSYTIGLDTIPKMLEKLDEAKEFPIIKIKVGMENDHEIIQAIRDHRPDAILRVDANTGWGVTEAIDRINDLEQFNIEFIEQPIQTKNYEGLKKIRENTNIPIMADEDAVDSSDLPKLQGCVDMINIKLMKCRGLNEALKMIHTARALGFKIMMGCMAESSLSLTAAAHLSPLIDYADLDYHLLMTNDPYRAMKIKKGKIHLPSKSGIGYSLI